MRAHLSAVPPPATRSKSDFKDAGGPKWDGQPNREPGSTVARAVDVRASSAQRARGCVREGMPLTSAGRS
jgi:hypothetical protein